MTWKEIETENMLLLLFLGIGVAGFLLSLQYSLEVRRFPQLATGIIIIGSILLLIREHVPEPFQSIVAQDEQMFSSATEIEEQVDEKTDDELLKVNMNQTEPSTRLNIDNQLFLVGSMFAYAVFGQLIGLLWISPLFVFIYTVNNRKSWLAVGSLTILSFVIAYLFMITLNLPLATGILTGGS